ncbi:MAG: nuclear transport factor 2 family protein [Dehalococcoidia bacterium]
MSNLETVQAIYDAFGQGNVPAILDQLDEAVEWERPGAGHGVPWLKPGRGKAHVGQFFASLAVVDISKFVPVNLLAGGNQVVAVIDIELTVKATGQAVRDEELHLWTFGPDGKVSSFHHVVDTAQHVAAYRGQLVSA